MVMASHDDKSSPSSPTVVDVISTPAQASCRSPSGAMTGGNNLIRLQQMFPRIVAAEFQQPLHVSADCQTLLSRMLTPDPAKRITIGEIMQHPWWASPPVNLMWSSYVSLGQH